jgi:hypothetical protein
MSSADYSRNQVKVPIREVGTNVTVKGVTMPTRTYMSNKLVPGCNVYLELTWVYQMPEPSFVVPSMHSHPYDQVTMLIGSDPNNPESLGGEVESYLGDTRMVSDKTNALFIPGNVQHGKVSWKKFERPHILMSITLGNGDFEQVDPAGYNK